MTRALQNAAATASRTRHHPLERRAFTDHRLLHDQSVRFQVGVVLCVSDCALERLVDQKCRFFRRECEQIECGRNRQTLDLTRDFAHLEGRNPRILIYRSHFHRFATYKVTTLQQLHGLHRKGVSSFVTLVTFLSLLTFITSNSYRTGHPPEAGRLLLFFPSLNPFLESRRRKFSASHLPLAVLRSFGRRALRASACQF